MIEFMNKLVCGVGINDADYLTQKTEKIRGNYMIGCYKRKGISNFKATINSIFTGKTETLGSFSTEIEAPLEWKKRKLEYTSELIRYGLVTGTRVAKSLLNKRG